MKKKIALLLAAVMVVGSLPMTAFASSDNTVSKIQTVEDGEKIDVSITLDDFKGYVAGDETQTIKLTLTNAKFRSTQYDDGVTGGRDITVDDCNSVQWYKWDTSQYVKTTSADGEYAVAVYGGVTYLIAAGGTIYEEYDIAGTKNAIKITDASTQLDAVAAADIPQIRDNVEYTEISDTEAMAEFDITSNDDVIVLKIDAEANGSGDASVTIEATDSIVSSQTLKIANIAGGATTATISGTTSIREKSTKIKNIVITETTAGSIDKDGTIKLKLTNGFKWAKNPEGTTTGVKVFPTDCGLELDTSDPGNGIEIATGEDDQVLYIHLKNESTDGKPATISLQNIGVYYDEDDVEVGDECEVTISDAGTSKQSLTIGTASDYGVSFTVEDKDLPTFYAGRYDDEVETLNVTIKENIEGSWLEGRKTKITFPEGVEVMSVNEEDTDKVDDVDYTIDENEVEIDVDKASSGKAEVELNFELSISPEFTGDIEATLTGSGVGDDQTVTVGTAVFPVTVDADVNELKIDYRNTAASDIVITEADAGALAKGKTVSLSIDGIEFDGDPTVEVESGDMKIENVKVNKGTLTFEVKTASQKEAAVIRISDIELYMQRSLPAGEYDLLIVTSDEDDNIAVAGTTAGDADVSGNILDTTKDVDNAIIQNYSSKDDDATGLFDVDEVTAKEGYVTVVTAGRDQGDETFTTTVTVTIGADKMYAGTKEIVLDVPAYISNGYTMLPVRAVTEALSDSAIVRWDDPTHTVTITFGDRVINMVVGSSTMVINGVEVPMQAQCEITDSRAFIPLRDMGYALGLNDSKINWDDATKTATLN